MSQQDTSNYVVINNSATKLQITVSVDKGEEKQEQRGNQYTPKCMSSKVLIIQTERQTTKQVLGPISVYN